jgi:hypothetical protein
MSDFERATRQGGEAGAGAGASALRLGFRLCEVRMRRQKYRMCELTKPVDGGVARMISWIREEIAIPGQTLMRLEDTDTGVIENGWTVESAATPAYPEELLMRQARDYRKQRAASDI